MLNATLARSARSRGSHFYVKWIKNKKQDILLPEFLPCIPVSLIHGALSFVYFQIFFSFYSSLPIYQPVPCKPTHHPAQSYLSKAQMGFSYSLSALLVFFLSLSDLNSPLQSSNVLLYLGSFSYLSPSSNSLSFVETFLLPCCQIPPVFMLKTWMLKSVTSERKHLSLN